MSKGRRLQKAVFHCITCGKTYHPWHKEQRACSKPCRQYRWTADELERRRQHIQTQTAKGANAARRKASVRWGALAKDMTPAQVLAELNRIGGENGIGRLDIVENRFVGMKSRGCYETPGGTIMLKAHRAIESITLDREVAHLKDELMPKYASLIYNGFWWSPERLMLQQMIDASQANVNGVVRLKLYKGNVIVTGRKSDDSLFDANIATFEEDGGAYNQQDAAGFIKLNALRMRIAAGKGRKLV